MTQSGIWKIEKGQPRRRIAFDEAVAFAEVFGLSLEDLSTDPRAEMERLAAEAARRVWEEVEAIEGSGWELRTWLDTVDGMLGRQSADSALEGKAFYREFERRLGEPGGYGRLAYDGLTAARGRESAEAFLERARYLATVTEAKADG